MQAVTVIKRAQMRFGRLLILAFLVEAGLSDPHAVGRIGSRKVLLPSLFYYCRTLSERGVAFTTAHREGWEEAPCTKARFGQQ